MPAVRRVLLPPGVRCGLFLLVLAAVVRPAAPVRGAETEPTPDERLLQERQIVPDRAGIGEYLRRLHPTSEQKRQTEQWIAGLGSTESFAARETAMSRLLAMPTLPVEALAAAGTGADPEVRWRAKKILDEGRPESVRILGAALRTVEHRRIRGLVPDLLRAIPLCDQGHLESAARAALVAGAQDVDAAALRSALKHELPRVRIAAAAALARSSKAQAAEDLVKLLDDPDEPVRLAAARALLDFGDRRGLAAALAMLSSGEMSIRVGAHRTLRETSGQDFRFVAYAAPADRQAAAARWKTWIEGPGATAELRFPLKPLRGGSHLGGNTLLAFGYQNRVVEYDAAMKEIWSYPAVGAWRAEKLANGHYLIAEYNAGKVIEVDRDKKIVWEYPVQSPLNVKPLENGNVLIASHGNQALEVTPQKEVVWKHPTRGNCSDVHRLENGNTLVACYGTGLEEVTPEGKVTWTHPASQCYGCHPLPDGNVLVCDFSGRVDEIDREHRVVWTVNETNAVDAFRLENGNTLITGGNRFVEVGPDKKVVWSLGGCTYGAARR